jgi:hypothetical protein
MLYASEKTLNRAPRPHFRSKPDLFALIFLLFFIFPNSFILLKKLTVDLNKYLDEHGFTPR